MSKSPDSDVRGGRWTSTGVFLSLAQECDEDFLDGLVPFTADSGTDPGTV
jgi:hypothetical protein